MSYGETAYDHVLIVHKRGGEDFEIEHAADCPHTEEASPIGPVRLWTCAVADHTDMFYRGGFPTLEPGRYELGAWWSKNPGGPHGPDEYDAGLNIGDRIAA